MSDESSPEKKRPPTGGPAFPIVMDASRLREGMTLRDYFAAQAMAGILAGGFADTVPHDDVLSGNNVAEFAYGYADAMLKRRAAWQ